VAIGGGQPSLGRYCAFGNLFASAGDAGEVFRIDRHPTMSRHPVTPMNEADLRKHFAAQGLDGVALVPYTAYSSADALYVAHAKDAPAMLFDVLAPEHLAFIGRMLRERAAGAPVLAVGPSSVIQAWAGEGTFTPAPVAPAEGPVFVLAGSLSPVTAGQVQAAKSFDKVWLEPAQLARGDAAAMASAVQDIVQRLKHGRSVIACTVAPDTARSPDVAARDLAHAGGKLLARLLEAIPLRRVGVAGGDLSPGASLCRLHSDVPALDGLELLLKGGQMGGADLFERLLLGVVQTRG
jgi:3-oxoisoapionate kinase